MTKFAPWLLKTVALAFRWLLANPVIWLVIGTTIIFNHLSQSSTFDISRINLASASSIGSVGLAAFAAVATPSGLLLYIGGGLLASIITIFATGSIFATFEGRAKAAMQLGFKALLSRRLFEYFLYQLAVGALMGLLLWPLFLLGVRQTEVLDLVLGITTTLVLCVAYTIFYMLLSTGALLLGAEGAGLEKLRRGSVFLEPANLKRLVVFYVIRITLEMLVVLAASVVLRWLGAGPWLSPFVFVMIMIIPLALVRTTGLIIKLEMIVCDPWFKRNFATYYQSRERGIAK